jgi:hypothetical protein
VVERRAARQGRDGVGHAPGLGVAKQGVEEGAGQRPKRAGGQFRRALFDQHIDDVPINGKTVIADRSWGRDIGRHGARMRQPQAPRQGGLVKLQVRRWIVQPPLTMKPTIWLAWRR